MGSSDGGIETVQAERDFFRALLELDDHDELESFVRRALALVVELAHARGGYLELRSPRDETTVVISVSHGDAGGDGEALRALLSSGVIAEAMATGNTIHTASALLDPRFRDRGSVRENRIEAVLCVPVGKQSPLGIIYLQECANGGPFAGQDQERVEQFARHLAPLAERLLLRSVAEPADPTENVRASLRAESLVGRSQAVAAVLEQAAVVAPRDVTVLITGASGTGKTQLARVIHANGPRATGPFVEVNCAALPETLLEGELFGAVAGAYSGAVRNTRGKVAAADAGTLFLDEIGELSPSAQSALLQLVQSGQYYRLGSSSIETANVRLIAATNLDLAVAIKERRFREDLYYRLAVLPIRMPALAERSEDIPLLAGHLSSRATSRHGMSPLLLSPAAELALQLAEWPGNVRQLANVVEAGALRASAEGVNEIQERHLFPAVRSADAGDLTYQQHLQRFRRTLVLRTLRDTNWNVAEAARRLDVARSYLNKLIRDLDLHREA